MHLAGGSSLVARAHLYFRPHPNNTLKLVYDFGPTRLISEPPNFGPPHCGPSSGFESSAGSSNFASGGTNCCPFHDNTAEHTSLLQTHGPGPIQGHKNLLNMLQIRFMLPFPSPPAPLTFIIQIQRHGDLLGVRSEICCQRKLRNTLYILFGRRLRTSSPSDHV